MFSPSINDEGVKSLESRSVCRKLEVNSCLRLDVSAQVQVGQTERGTRGGDPNIVVVPPQTEDVFLIEGLEGLLYPLPETPPLVFGLQDSQVATYQTAMESLNELSSPEVWPQRF